MDTGVQCSQKFETHVCTQLHVSRSLGLDTDMLKKLLDYTIRWIFLKYPSLYVILFLKGTVSFLGGFIQ